MKTDQITASKLAKELGCSRQLIAYHRKSKDAPPLGDVDGWRVFLAEIGREGSLPPDLRMELGRVRIRIGNAQAAKLERENKVKDGELIEYAEAEKFIRHLCAVLFWGELDRMAQEFPASLKGKNEIEIHQEVLRQIEIVKKNLRAAYDTWDAQNKPNENKATDKP